MPRFPTWLERLQYPDLHSDDLVGTPPPPADSGPAMEDEPDEWYGTAEDNEQAAMDAKKTTRELGEDRRMGITNTFGRELDAKRRPSGRRKALTNIWRGGGGCYYLVRCSGPECPTTKEVEAFGIPKRRALPLLEGWTYDKDGDWLCPECTREQE